MAAMFVFTKAMGPSDLVLALNLMLFKPSFRSSKLSNKMVTFHTMQHLKALNI